MQQTVLIIDDSMTVRMDLAEAFQSAGLRPILCATAAEARAALREQVFGVIVLDLLLPDADGIDLLREFRASSAVTTPVILLSTEAEVRDRIRGLETGADEYVGKPYEKSYVTARARELLRRRQPPSGGVERLAPVLIIDDSPTFREALASAAEAAGHVVATAGSGEEGLSLAADLRPMAVVVDGTLPGIDGATVIRRIRLDAALRATPCLLLTASEDQGAEFRALDSGADAFARKHEDMPVILARLAAMLRSAQGRTETPDTASLLGPKRILAVDDSPTFLHALCEALCGEGYDVVPARSGEEALEMLAVQPVDCILLDLMMPGLGGKETCRRIKAASGIRDIPLIILTALEEQAALIEVLSTGADDYIAKSCDLEVLRARMRAQIRRKQIEDENRRIREELLRKELHAAEALRESELKYRRIVETAQEGIWVIDAAMRTSYVNQRMAQMLGSQPDALCGAPLPDFADQDTAPMDLRDFVRGAQQETGQQFEVRFKRRDGSAFWGSVSANPIRDSDGAYAGALIMVADVTDRRELQAQLLISDRMASVGMLAAGVAHEINNPLTAVLANLELAAAQVDELCENETLAAALKLRQLRDELSDAREASERVRNIVRDLRVFSRSEEDVRSPVDVQSVLESSVRMAWNEIRHRAALVKNLRAVPAVEANESKLGQVFLNLLVNAAQAIPDGRADANEIHVETHVAADARVVIEIRDTGPGMPPEVVKRLFTPFFTTKPAGLGTGLGLSICQRIVTTLGGEIQVESQPGVGSAFRVVLPAAAGGPAASTRAAPSVRTPLRRGRILVVDDEPIAVMVLERVLSPDHDVTSVNMAQDALDKLAAGERFDLILCDLIMPEKTGMDLYEELARLAPDQAERLVFVTGGAFTARANEFLDRVQNPRLEKPFEVATLRALIADQLAKLPPITRHGEPRGLSPRSYRGEGCGMAEERRGKPGGSPTLTARHFDA